jgi:predicted  nucleic acid-binding Zn-ribbon protein
VNELEAVLSEREGYEARIAQMGKEIDGLQLGVSRLTAIEKDMRSRIQALTQELTGRSVLCSRTFISQNR